MGDVDYRPVQTDDEIHGNYSEALLNVPNSKNESRKKLLSSITTAISNLSVQYNFGSIAAALILMSSVECTSTPEECANGEQAIWVTGTATATVFVGAITGQLTMGYAGDVLGRDKAMRLTLGIAALSALLSSLAPHGPSTAVYIVIIIFRFLMGIGLGGVYPLSAVKAAEDGGTSDGKVDSYKSSLAFFWQTPGSMLPWLVAYIFTFTDNLSMDTKWRLLLGLGFIPSALVVLCSYAEDYVQAPQLPPPVRVSEVVTGFEKSVSSMSIVDLLRSPSIRRKLLVTGGGWFLYDICYYGVNLFGGEILDAISTASGEEVSSDKSMRGTSSRQLLALSAGLPAVIMAILLLRPLGTKRLQWIGFLVIAVCFTAMSVLFYPLKKTNKDALFGVYCVLLFSLSFGPNVTTFVLPAETYPKRIRSTFNGISAALGKLGAVVGAYMFGPIAAISSYPVVMAICAVFALLGAALSYWCIEDAADESDVESNDSRSEISIQGKL